MDDYRKKLWERHKGQIFLGLIITLILALIEIFTGFNVK